MPRFPDSNLLFIHIPKTGGSSIEAFLIQKEKRFPNGYSTYNYKDRLHQEKYLIQYVYKNQKCSYQHYTYLELKKKVPEIDQYLIFTVVRSPYDRLVSDFHYFTKCDPNDPKLRMKFKDFMYDFLYHPGSIPDKYDNHYVPQYKFIEGCNPIILRFENLEEDFLNFYGEPLNMKINVTDRLPDYQKYYTLETAVIAENYYKEDFKHFGYDNTLSLRL